MGIRSLASGYELPCGHWDPNPGLLEEQSMLLTAEPFLQPQQATELKHYFNRFQNVKLCRIFL